MKFSRHDVRYALWRKAYSQKQIPGLEPFFWIVIVGLILFVVIK